MLTPVTPLLVLFNISGSAEAPKTECIVMGQDGTTYGYDSSIPIGSVEPDHTLSGIFRYANRFDKLGNFVLKYGDSGNEQFDGMNRLYIYFNDYKTARYAQWNDTLKLYSFNDTDLADQIGSDYDKGEISKLCFWIGAKNDLLAIDYTYSEFINA